MGADIRIGVKKKKSNPLTNTFLFSLPIAKSNNGRDKSDRGWSLCSLHSCRPGEPASGGKLFCVPGVSEGASYHRMWAQLLQSVHYPLVGGPRAGLSLPGLSEDVAIPKPPAQSTTGQHGGNRQAAPGSQAEDQG